ncbi:MAG: radical SAM protein [Desulfobacteraceae bacterium]|nr:radical SAM protein [Desulfobacteraceae bacterium]MBC2755102.1 radical SAM protein [Desulfobacteraceae bacterium]
MKIALINTNRIKPPIAPIGLEYIAETLISSGHQVEILDTCWSDDTDQSISRFFLNNRFALVGLTLRNTDDCALTSRQSFLEEFADTANKIRNLTDAVIAVGGVGFSTMPEHIMTLCNLDVGICGDGEFTFPELADRIEANKDWTDLPGIIFPHNKKWHRHPPRFRSLDNLPTMRRNLIDNRRYFAEGGQAGVETKRGCPGKCIYCADPIAKGHEIRVRPAKAVVDEIENLLKQGIDHLHTCDSEFNLPARHAEKVCAEIITRNIGDKLRWYAYCSPQSFSRKLAELMREAGCVGINFGVDNGDESMLKSLKRDFTPDDIINAARFCKESNITVMFDLLLGAPGETKSSITTTIELMKKATPDRVGVSLGVRIYPKTEMADMVENGKIRNGLSGGTSIHDPLFFLEPEIAPVIYDLLDDLIKGDERFLFFNPDKPNQNYNYNANDLLVQAIARGHRGAFWDILRQIA